MPGGERGDRAGTARHAARYACGAGGGGVPGACERVRLRLLFHGGYGGRGADKHGKQRTYESFPGLCNRRDGDSQPARGRGEARRGGAERLFRADSRIDCQRRYNRADFCAARRVRNAPVRRRGGGGYCKLQRLLRLYGACAASLVHIFSVLRLHARGGGHQAPHVRQHSAERFKPGAQSGADLCAGHGRDGYGAILPAQLGDSGGAQPGYGAAPRL